MTDHHICVACGHLDGDHGDGYCTKASGGCPCFAFQPPRRPPTSSTHPREPPTQPFDLEAVTKALLAIADAIRGLTPNAVQDAAGCPQNDPQPADGRTDGGNDAEAGEPRFKPGGYVTSPWVEQNLRDRAEKAEAERDAILADLRAAFRNWTHDAGYPVASDVVTIINRHTSEG